MGGVYLQDKTITDNNIPSNMKTENILKGYVSPETKICSLRATRIVCQSVKFNDYDDTGDIIYLS